MKAGLQSVVWLAGAAVVCAQPGPRVEDLAPGKLLVAQRRLPDPNFAQTVVLLIQHDRKGAMGLIVNRLTKYTLARIAEDLKEAKGRSDPIYEGGPVERGVVFALMRSRAKVEDARRVFGDVYMISSKAQLEKTLAAAPASDSFRVYIGYAGWGPGQLEAEVELGTWLIFPGDSRAVFDPEPGAVWPRLVRQVETQIAGRGLSQPEVPATTAPQAGCDSAP
ncbi:MAG: YqgE/AlgH family protein [Verrucomicrobiales bacterium]|nr:YqgE/AlgH family protein [Verrucomicrobiales bacterium]